MSGSGGKEELYLFDTETAVKSLERKKSPKIAVVGDYCLDKYLYIDASLEEPSVETGLPAHRVRRKGIYPGAAGTIACNLAALGADVKAVGLCGNDGEGWELTQKLAENGIDPEGVLKHKGVMTSTYIKPILESKGTARELNRLDIRNNRPAPENALAEIEQILNKILPQCAAVVIADQFTFQAGSVLSGRIPDLLDRFAESSPATFVMADSRSNASRYRNVLIKCNASELLDLDNRLEHPDIPAKVGADPTADGKTDFLLKAGSRLVRRNNRPILVTRGANGSILFSPNHNPIFVPAVPVSPPIDICGAGDATNAGLAFARAVGIELPEAALIAGIVSSITIKQIGVTGTASIGEVVEILTKRFCRTTDRV